MLHLARAELVFCASASIPFTEYWIKGAMTAGQVLPVHVLTLSHSLQVH
jgi:hypothetical protein